MPLSGLAVVVATALAIPVSRVGAPSPDVLVTLGRRLFEDTRLSGDGTVSCAKCHRAEEAFADHEAVARGIGGRKGTRNAPSVLNVQFSTSFFWDGRRATLEEQIGDPFINPNEHGLKDHEVLLAIVRRDEEYLRQFHLAFRGALEAPSVGQIEQAIAAYLRSLRAVDSPFDRYRGGDVRALTEAQRRGLTVFEGRGRCVTCHRTAGAIASFTDDAFHAGRLPEAIARDLSSITALVANTPPAARFALIGSRSDVAALGRFVVTLDPADIGKFRTPSLRNVAVTPPYMHDGSAGTLEQAIHLEAYSRSERPLILTPSEVADLAAFLGSLTSAVSTTLADAKPAIGAMRAPSQPER